MKKRKEIMLLAALGVASVGYSADTVYPGCPVVEPDCPCDYTLPDMNNYGVMFGVKGCETDKLVFSGLLAVDSQYIFVDDKSPDHNPSDVNNARIRFARVRFDAELGEGWSGRIVMDFSGKKTKYQYTNTNTVEKQTMTTNWCHGIFGLHEAFVQKYCSGNYFQAGFKKVKFGRENIEPAADLKAIERSIANNFFNGIEQFNPFSGSPLGVGDRYVGLHMNGQYDHVFYSASLVNGYQCADSCSNETNNELAVFAGIGFETDFNCWDIEIGLNAGHKPKGMRKFRTENPSALGLGERAQLTALNPYAVIGWNKWDLMMDFFWAKIEKGQAITNANTPGDATPYGISVMPSYMYDEHWEFVGRFSYIDTDYHGVRISNVVECAPDTFRANTVNSAFVGGDVYNIATSLYGGINYYLMNKAIKFSLGYEWTQFKDRATDTPDNTQPIGNFFTGDKTVVHAVRARAQIVF